MITLNSSRHLQIFIIIIGFFHLSQQFYLPGLAPVNYCKESEKTKSCKVSMTTTNELRYQGAADSGRNFLLLCRHRDKFPCVS
jgi:hypothetical protein